MAQSTYQLLDLTENTILDWPSSFPIGPVILDINDINPDQGGWYIAIPDATLVSIGQNFIINNVSSFSFTIKAFDLTTTIHTVASGDVYALYLIDNGTQNGTWRVVPYGSGTNAITALTAESTDSSIVISNGIISPPGGTINFKLPTSLSNLNAVGTSDILVVKSFSPLTFTTAELHGGSNITVTNGTGISGDPVITLNSALSGLTSAQIGDITISGEVIAANKGSNLQIVTEEGDVQINGVTISDDGSISGFTNLVSPKAYCAFTDTITGMDNTIVVEDQVNIASVTGSGGTYVITFTTPMSSINYGVFITLGSTGGSLPFISNAYYIVRDLDAVTIIVTDASGELVLSAPNGVSVMIMQS